MTSNTDQAASGLEVYHQLPPHAGGYDGSQYAKTSSYPIPQPNLNFAPSPEAKTAREDVEAAGGVVPVPPPIEKKRPRKICGLPIATAILSAVIFVLIVAIGVIGGLFGSKISALERTTAPLAQQAVTPGPLPPATSRTSRPPRPSQTGQPTPTVTTTSPTDTDTKPTPTMLGVSVAGWTYRGCYRDLGSMRVLGDDAMMGFADLTNAKCAEACRAYYFFATENGDICFCGDTPNHRDLAPEWACNRQCPGNGESFETCGGFSVLDLWEWNDEEEE